MTKGLSIDEMRAKVAEADAQAAEKARAEFLERYDPIKRAFVDDEAMKLSEVIDAITAASNAEDNRQLRVVLDGFITITENMRTVVSTRMLQATPGSGIAPPT